MSVLYLLTSCFEHIQKPDSIKFLRGKSLSGKLLKESSVFQPFEGLRNPVTSTSAQPESHSSSSMPSSDISCYCPAQSMLDSLLSITRATKHVSLLYSLLFTCLLSQFQPDELLELTPDNFYRTVFRSIFGALFPYVCHDKKTDR